MCDDCYREQCDMCVSYADVFPATPYPGMGKCLRPHGGYGKYVMGFHVCTHFNCKVCAYIARQGAIDAKYAI